MTELFNDYMDKIVADDNLKEKTRKYVRSHLSAQYNQNEDRDNKTISIRNKFIIKKLKFTMAAVAACAALTIGAYAYYSTPVNYISLDINPSVELGINAFDSVVSVEAYNVDGEQLIQGIKLKNLSPEKALDKLVHKAKEEGYIEADGSTVIAVTAQSDDQDYAEELQNNSEQSVYNVLESVNVRAVIYANCSSLELREDAKEMGISPGKYKMIDLLMSLDSNITSDQFKDAKMKDIISKAGELLTTAVNSGVELDLNEKTLDKIMKAADKVKEIEEIDADIIEAIGETDVDNDDNDDTDDDADKDDDSGSNNGNNNNDNNGNGNDKPDDKHEQNQNNSGNGNSKQEEPETDDQQNQGNSGNINGNSNKPEKSVTDKDEKHNNSDNLYNTGSGGNSGQSNNKK